MYIPSGTDNITKQFKAMHLAPREYIDMAVAKEGKVTRPATLKSKKGTRGQPVKLFSNYFPIQTKKDWDIFQYRVDFEPEIPDLRIRKILIQREKPKIGGNCFDGTMMFTVKQVPVKEIATKLPNDENQVVQIKLREVGVLSRTDQRFLQIYGIIMKRVQAGLGLTQMGRNQYDMKDLVSEGS